MLELQRSEIPTLHPAIVLAGGNLTSGETTWTAETHVGETTFSGVDVRWGTDYMHARYYNPQVGRFLSMDPVLSSKANFPQTWNRYTYARNNPLLMVDPDGRAELTFTLENYIQRSFVPGPGGFLGGDARGPSLDTNRTFRTQNVIRVETDPRVNPGGLISQQARTGLSMRMGPLASGSVKFAQSAGDSIKATTARGADGSLIIHATQNEEISKSLTYGIGSLGHGIRSDLTLTISPDGSVVSALGQRSSFPSMQISMTGADGITTILFSAKETVTPLGIFGTSPIGFICRGGACSEHVPH